MTVVLRPAAITDVKAAVEYYAAADPPIADEFIGHLDRLFARLQSFPASAPSVDGYEPVRRALVHRFPFAVFYLASDDSIEVLRVVHTARAPHAWRSHDV